LHKTKKMAQNIYEEILRKHSLEELKTPALAQDRAAQVSAEQSLEKITLSTPVVSPEKALSASVPSQKKYSFIDALKEVKEGLVLWGLVVGVLFGAAYFKKRDSQYEFDGYIGKEKVHFYETLLQNTDRLEIEKESGEKILYLSSWVRDEEVSEVIRIKPNGDEAIICDEDSCLGEATKIALEYKLKILEEKKTKFNESLKE